MLSRSEDTFLYRTLYQVPKLSTLNSTVLQVSSFQGFILNKKAYLGHSKVFISGRSFKKGFPLYMAESLPMEALSTVYGKLATIKGS